MPRPSPLARLRTNSVTLSLDKLRNYTYPNPPYGWLNYANEGEIETSTTCASTTTTYNLIGVETTLPSIEVANSSYQPSLCSANLPNIVNIGNSPGVLGTQNPSEIPFRQNRKKSKTVRRTHIDRHGLTLCDSISKAFDDLLNSFKTVLTSESRLKLCMERVCSLDLGCSTASTGYHNELDGNYYDSNEPFELKCPPPWHVYSPVKKYPHHHSREHVQSQIYVMNKDVNDNISTFGPDSSHESKAGDADDEIPSKLFYEAYINYQIKCRNQNQYHK